MRIDLRIYPRHKCDAPAVIFRDRFSSVVMLNFSLGGMYFEISDPCETGEYIIVKANHSSILDHFGSGTGNKRLAEVRWCKGIGVEKSRRYGCGIAFI